MFSLDEMRGPPDFVSNSYSDLLAKINSGETFTEQERMLLSHDHLQRYSNRILNDEEFKVYSDNKFLGHITGLAVSFATPFTVASMILAMRNPGYYSP